MERLLKLRKEIKKRKPRYVRQQYGYFPRLSNVAKWRKPRGIHSKILMRRKGHRKMPEVGYGSPKVVRGLNRFGKREVLVYNLKDLERIDKKSDIVVIASTVGKRKRLDILNKCKELKLDVSNYKNVEQVIEKIEKLLVKRKEMKKLKEAKKLERENKKENKGSKKETEKNKVDNNNEIKKNKVVETGESKSNTETEKKSDNVNKVKKGGN